jgi:hypothetical protein
LRAQGYLLPSYHKNYWLGLTADDQRKWSWLDKTSFPSYGNSKYINWGVLQPGSIPEPNNAVDPPETCAVANFTMTPMNTNPYRAFWADTSCYTNYISICRLSSKWRPLPAIGLLPRLPSACHCLRPVVAGILLTGMAWPALPCPALATAPGPQLIYTNDTTGVSYLLNTQPTNFTAAEQYCNDNGGHLIGLGSLEEQHEVEEYYINDGQLFPLYHQVYWNGLRAQSWPRFSWIDNVTPMPSGSNYRQWGTYQPGNIAEPNSLVPGENCGVSNHTQSYGNVWGWADANCDNEFPFICEIPSEPPRHARARPHRAATPCRHWHARAAGRSCCPGTAPSRRPAPTVPSQSRSCTCTPATGRAPPTR